MRHLKALGLIAFIVLLANLRSLTRKSPAEQCTSAGRATICQQTYPKCGVGVATCNNNLSQSCGTDDVHSVDCDCPMGETCDNGRCSGASSDAGTMPTPACMNGQMSGQSASVASRTAIIAGDMKPIADARRGQTNR